MINRYIKATILTIMIVMNGSMTTISGQVTYPVEINETNFPDANFRGGIYFLYDTDKDWKLSEEEIQNVTTLSAVPKTTAKGIEFFTNIYRLDWQNTTIKELDLTHNSNLKYIRLSNIDSLTTLVFPHTNATDSDLEVVLNQVNAPAPLSLDFSQAVNLKRISFDGVNIGSVSFAGNSNLTYIRLDGTQNLNSVVLPQSGSKLEEFRSGGNLINENNIIEDIDFSTSVNLKVLNFDTHCLSNADLSNCVKLEYVRLSHGPLKRIKLPSSNILTSVYVDDNQLSSIDLSVLPNLRVLDINSNRITELDLRNNKELTILYSFLNIFLTELDLSQNTKLESVNIVGCQINDIDLSCNPLLTGENLIQLSPQFMVLQPQDIQVYGSNRDKLLFALPDYSSAKYDDISNVKSVEKDAINNESLEIITINGRKYATVEYSLPAKDVNRLDIDTINDEYLQYYESINFSHKIAFAPEIPDSISEKPLKIIQVVPPHFLLYLNPATNQNGNNRDGVYMGTLYLGEETFIPTDANQKIYVASNITLESENQGNLLLEEKTGSEILPINSGVLVTSNSSGWHLFVSNSEIEYIDVQGTYGSFYIDRFGYKRKQTLSPYSNNIMTGTYRAPYPVEPMSVLTLGRRTDDGSGLIGFWNYSGNKINPYRTFIPTEQIPSLQQTAVFTSKFPGLTLSFHDENGSVTNIKSTLTMDANQADMNINNTTYYDLQGRRVTNPQRGGMYIVNGKKVIL